ncbi:MAG: N-acyl homoserine lactonase family protein [bacterium]|nr:N-acyl homoserine lactonase family protein [bacterium]
MQATNISKDLIRAGVAVAPTSITTANGIRVHHIQTGFVAVKKVHRRYHGINGTGILAIVADPRWTEWMPISVWAIEHPEGVILVDTGDVPQANDRNYYACDKGSAFFYTSFLRFSVTPEEQIHAQLSNLGIHPSDVRWVIQTHLHGDHIHGINHFSQSEIIVSSIDYPKSLGAVPCLYPSWLNPTFTRFQPHDIAGFKQAHIVTKAQDVMIVPTPGHSNGHQSILLRDNDQSYIFAGDASFDEAQLLSGEIAGIASNPKASRQTLANIRTYCAWHPTVYLPTHDHETTKRLRENQVVTIVK